MAQSVSYEMMCTIEMDHRRRDFLQKQNKPPGVLPPI